jgi:hypothetical protein
MERRDGAVERAKRYDPAEREEAAALDREILAFLARASASWSADQDGLDRLLLAVFAYQVRWNPAYARYVAARGATPDRVRRPAEIPPVPARAFAASRMATFAPEATVRRFRSSGTTGGPRSVLELDTLALYDAALCAPFARHILPDGPTLAWIALTPDPALVPDSSLAYMIGSAARQLGVAPLHAVAPDLSLDVPAAITALRGRAAAGEPVLLLATAIALLALIDALAAAGAHIALAPGSRIMETGGFKGRARAVERRELYATAADRLGVPPHAIVGEYGMTEMLSQFYDTTLRDAVTGRPGAPADDPGAPRAKVGPPWVRTMVLDPVTLAPVPLGEVGVLAHLDLAARSSAVAILTEDCGRALAAADPGAAESGPAASGAGFELRGRMPGAAARGCSLALDEYLRHDAGFLK